MYCGNPGARGQVMQERFPLPGRLIRTTAAPHQPIRVSRGIKAGQGRGANERETVVRAALCD